MASDRTAAAPSELPANPVQRSPLRFIFAALVFPALGAALGFVLLVTVVQPWLGLGTVERIAAIGRHLERPLPPATTVFLGNSIVREGIDVGALSVGPAQNLAISGCNWTEYRAMAPRLAAARPATVVLGLYALDAIAVPTVELDKAFAYAAGGFADAWPQEWKTRDAWGPLSGEVFEALTAGRLEQQLHFRTLPLSALEDFVRRRSRTTLRPIAPTNFTDPFEMSGSVRDERLAWHLETVRGSLRSSARVRSEEALSQLRDAVSQLRRARVRVLLVILPVHPALRADLDPVLTALRADAAELADGSSVAVIDASSLLEAAAFADALHPNAEGRHLLSRRVGDAIAGRFASPASLHAAEAP